MEIGLRMVAQMVALEIVETEWVREWRRRKMAEGVGFKAKVELQIGADGVVNEDVLHDGLRMWLESDDGGEFYVEDDDGRQERCFIERVANIDIQVTE